MIRTSLPKKIVPTLLFLFGFLISEASATSTVHELLKTPAFGDSDALKKLFSMGTSNIDQYVEALRDSDQAVSDNAQLMIQLLGDKRGLDALDKWHQTTGNQHFVLGPVTSPLRDLDYEHFDERIIGKPYDKWIDIEAVNFVLALTIDGSSRAREELERMRKKIPPDDTYSTISKVMKRIATADFDTHVCGGNKLERSVLNRSTFLTTEELRNTTVTLVAFDDKASKALLLEFDMWGPTYWIVLERKPSRCWIIQSISFRGQNN